MLYLYVSISVPISIDDFEIVSDLHPVLGRVRVTVGAVQSRLLYGAAKAAVARHAANTTEFEKCIVVKVDGWQVVNVVGRVGPFIIYWVAPKHEDEADSRYPSA